MSNREFTENRTALANAFAAAGAELLGYLAIIDTAVAAIPDTQPQKYAVAGTLNGILSMAGKMMGEDGAEQQTGDLTFDQIEDAFPEVGMYARQEDGALVSSAQWLHDFAHNIARAAIAAHLARQPKAEQQATGLESENELISMVRMKQIRDGIRQQDGMDGDDWDFALANAVAAHLARQAQAEPVTRLDVLSLIHAQCHRAYASAIDREEIDTKYMVEIEDSLRRLAAPAAPAGAQNAVPDDVRRALDRMCTPLDESRLNGATAQEDARCMRIIKQYIEAGAQNAEAIRNPWISVKDQLPKTEHECTSRDLMVSNSFYVRGVAADGGEGFGMADYQEDGKWHCYGGDYDFMHVVEVTHYLPIRPAALQTGSANTQEGDAA
jgi:hypothetical protein